MKAWCGLGLLILFATSVVEAQELEPRAYRTLPTGFNFVAFGYSFASGNVVLDQSLPIEDFEATTQTITVSYLRSFGMFGRSASVSAVVPVVHLSASATLAGDAVSGSRSGTGDARVRLAVNLLGGPALAPAEFATYRQRRNLGISLTLVPPTGSYDPDRLINFGANRWSFKPEMGYSSVRGRWIFDLAIGAWFFTTNPDFLIDSSRSQEPIGSVQGHISYNFKNRIWIAIDANYYTGGRTAIDDVDNFDLQQNSRYGLTLSLPIRGRHSVKVLAQSGAFTRAGADFDVATVVYQYGWSSR